MGIYDRFSVFRQSFGIVPSVAVVDLACAVCRMFCTALSVVSCGTAHP